MVIIKDGEITVKPYLVYGPSYGYSYGYNYGYNYGPSYGSGCDSKDCYPIFLKRPIVNGESFRAQIVNAAGGYYRIGVGVYNLKRCSY